jgi:sialic acid synthase SpsE
MKQIQIGNKLVGEGQKTFIIAEIGSNHNQSLDLAYKTIDAAIECGADAVKFQSIQVDELYINASEPVKTLHRKIDMEESWHKLLKDYCDKKNIIFFSSPTYLKAVDILEEINVDLYKLASAQIGTFPQMTERVAQTGKPVILSTGIVSYSELENAVKIFLRNKNENFIVLHCNSIYPTPYNKVNLELMDVYKQMFGCIIGFSDHTPGIYVPIAAVAKGAKVIEKHFALDISLPVPDAPFSLEPKDFKAMVEGIRAAEQAVNIDYRIEIQPEEQQFKHSILYRLVVNKLKRQGELFTKEDFEYKRNPEGIDCRNMEYLLKFNGSASRNIVKGELMHWDMVKMK